MLDGRATSNKDVVSLKMDIADDSLVSLFVMRVFLDNAKNMCLNIFQYIPHLLVLTNFGKDNFTNLFIIIFTPISK